MRRPPLPRESANVTTMTFSLELEAASDPSAGSLRHSLGRRAPFEAWEELFVVAKRVGLYVVVVA